MPAPPGSLIPPPHRPESARLLGLLFAMAMLALVARWLQPGDPSDDEPAFTAQPASLDEAALPGTGLRLTDARGDARIPALGTGAAARLRPVSAALCHALDEKLKGLRGRAHESLPRAEQRELRIERQRALDMRAALRCRAAGERYWF